LLGSFGPVTISVPRARLNTTEGLSREWHSEALPSFVIIDGAAGLEKALGLVWPDALVQRCTVHKHRNLLAHAPERLHEEVSADYNDMIYAGTPKEIETRRKSFIRK
jgi:transposase-like protein